jgi:hypothetical protein
LLSYLSLHVEATALTQAYHDKDDFMEADQTKRVP